jgi:polyferredoxin
LYGGVYDLYRDLKMSLLGVKVRFFSHGLPVLAEFFAIVWLARYAPRYWCRYVCPLGAVYAVPAKYSRIERIVQPCSRA